MVRKVNPGLFLVIGAGIFWGATLGLYARGMEALGFSPMQTAGVRMLVSFLAFALYSLLFNRGLFRIAWKDSWMFVGSGALSIGTFCYFYFTSLTYCPLSITAILAYTSPIFIILFSALFFKETITGQKLIAIFLALTGCALVSGILDGFAAVPWIGIITGLLAGFTYAMYSIFARIALRKYTTITINLYSFLFATLATLLPAGAGGTLSRLFASPQALLIGILGSLLCGAIPFFLYTKGMETLDTGKAGILATTEPLVSALVSVFILGEPMSLWGGIGIFFVLAAIILLSRPAKHEASSQQAN